jgi:hypothetical protein
MIVAVYRRGTGPGPLAHGIEPATGVPSAAGEAVVATWEVALADLPPDADHTAIARWLNDRTES